LQNLGICAMAWNPPELDLSSDYSSEEGSDSDLDTSDDEEFAGVSALAIAFNIAKGIVGIGILSLPAGIAAGTGLVTGLLILIAMYVVILYTFWNLGRCCEATHQKTHAGIGLALTGNHRFGAVMEVTNIIGTLLGCAGYALVIGRSSSDMWKAMGINAWFTDSRISFISIMVVVLLPLCLLRDLSKLAFTSMLGLACELSVIIFMIARYIGGEYQPGGRYYDSQEPGTQLSWGDADGPSLFDVNLTALVLVGTASNAFIAHWNSPKFYHQLRDRKPRSFLKATVGGFTLALVLYVACMIVGYLSFGKNCQGDILHNYSAKDQWATCSRGAMLFATIFGFPINFTGLRTAFLALFGLGSRRRIWVSVNVFLLAIICVLGCSFSDLGVLAAFGGSLLGALVIFVYPGLMVMWSYNRSQTFSSGKDIFRRVEGECVAPALVVFGVVLSLFGTTTVVLTDMLGVKLQ